MIRADGGDPSLLSFTPPRGEDEGKDIGDWAVSRDVSRVFAKRATIAAILGKTRGAKAKFNRDVRNGRLEEAKQFLNGQVSGTVQVSGYVRNGKQVKGYTQTREVSSLGDNRLGQIEHIGQTPNKMLHKARRGSKGSVKRTQWSQVVLRNKSYDTYLADVQKRVGTMKAGWRFAAKYLGVSLPPYVNSATNRINGSVNEPSSGPWKHSIEMVNTTPNISRFLTKSAIEWLKNHRLTNMELSIQHRVDRAIQATR